MLKKIFIVSVVGLLVAVCLPADAAINPDFTPTWQVGDTWMTRYRRMYIAVPAVPDVGVVRTPGDPEYINFEVIDLREVDGEMCYVVKIAYAHPRVERESKTFLELYVRKSDFTLKKVLELYREADNPPHIDKFYENGHDFILFSSPFLIDIACDFPNFPATNTNEERTIQEAGSSWLMTQKVTFIDAKSVEIELSAPSNNGLLKTIQVWEKGKPWWSSVKQTFIYNDIMKPGHPEVALVQYDNILEGTDTNPPDVSAAIVTPSVLWPPEHKMVEVTLSVPDDYDRYPDIEVLSVINSESDDAVGEGDGYTTKDTQVTEDGRIFLRAERDGNGPGRVYTINYKATDFSGNSANGSLSVTVPHDEGGS